MYCEDDMNKNEQILEVNHVSKAYKIYERPADRLKESLSIRKKVYHKEFHALKDVSFSIKRGENVGIIGVNGSGKSTLLKIISGIVQPSSGSLSVLGRISAILELGAGFNPEYSGIENIFINGTIMGVSKKEMQSKLDEIIAFADLGEFIEQPVKTYSSGMYARLAFSVAINISPDILIVDEALSVGDMGFQHKCMNKMKELVEEGVTVIFVSHDTFAIKSLCSRCIYLEKGVVKADGSSIEVTDQYLMDTRKKIYRAEAEEITVMNQGSLQALDNVNPADAEIDSITAAIQEETYDSEDVYKDMRYGTNGVRIQKVIMRNEKGEEADHFEFGEVMEIGLQLQAYQQIENLNCCIRIRDKNGLDITGTTTFEENMKFPSIKPGEVVQVSFTAPNLLKHDMTFSIGVTINDTRNIADQTILDHVDLAYTFKSVYNPKRPVWYMYYQDYNIKYSIS